MAEKDGGVLVHLKLYETFFSHTDIASFTVFYVFALQSCGSKNIWLFYIAVKDITCSCLGQKSKSALAMGNTNNFQVGCQLSRPVLMVKSLAYLPLNAQIFCRIKLRIMIFGHQ